ncbi:type I restriction-modification enzyme R subunit C-terminal domain-containing protein [Nocardia sp. R16R-3T]
MGAKIKEPTLVQVAGSVIVTKMDVVRRRGNIAVHRTGEVPAQDAVGAVGELFHVLYWLGRTYARTEEGKPFDGQRFDTSLIPRPVPELLALRLQLAHLTGDTSYDGLREKVQEIANALLDPGLNSITAIRQRHAFLEEVAGDAWWEDVTVPMLETLRRRLRGLVKAIPAKDAQNPLYTDFRDELGEVNDIAIAVLPGGGKGMARFESKVRTYLRSHEDVLAVQKLLRNKQITSADLGELENVFLDNGFGTAEDIEHAAATHGGLGLFLRSLTGLDATAAAAAFDEFHTGRTLTASQLHFLNLLTDYVRKNGVIEVGALYEQPFKAVAPTGPEDIFSDEDVDRIVAVVKNIRTTALPEQQAEQTAAHG